MERDIPEFTKYTIVLFALNESCRIQLGQSRPMAGKAQRDLGAKIQITWVHFGVFSPSHFAPQALSSDITQPGTVKNHKNQPGIMKNQPGTLKTNLNP